MSNILICDDEKDIVSALRICLAAEGYEIFEAYNGIQALEISEAYDITINHIFSPVLINRKIIRACCQSIRAC